MLWLFSGPPGVYLLDFFCSGIQFFLLWVGGLGSLFYSVVLGVLSSLAIILLGKRERAGRFTFIVMLLSMSCGSLVC